MPNLYSKEIESVCALFRNARADFEFYDAEVHRYERITQDLLHKLELDGLKYEERAKVATQLQQVRQERRKCKDNCATLFPMVDFLSGAKGAQRVRTYRTKEPEFQAKK